MNTEREEQRDFNTKAVTIVVVIITITFCLSLDNFFLNAYVNDGDVPAILLQLMAITIQIGLGGIALVIFNKKEYENLIFICLLIVFINLLCGWYCGYFENISTSLP